MTVLSVVLWILALLVVAATIALALTAIRFRRPRLALFAAVPIGLGLLGVALGIDLPAPDHAVGVITAIAIAIVGIIAGNPITVAILDYADRAGGSRTVTDGEHGGIVIRQENAPSTAAGQPEVLRGGTTIGYLERLVLVAAVVLGRFEIVVVLIAIKGLGRFSELDSPEARERFIIGTLVSLVWAGACAALIVL
ncbi:hypothetical protein BH09ACT4_BH09ACT4_02180 [soil metagenome]